MDAIRGQTSDDAIEKTLERVPKILKTTYETILDRINEKPLGQQALAKRVLIYIAHSLRPISIHLLSCIVSVETDTESLEFLKSSIPSDRMIVHACANLISVDRKTQEVRFVHPSAQKFLTSLQLSEGETCDIRYELAHRELAHREVARMLITLLSILYSESPGGFSNVGICPLKEKDGGLSGHLNVLDEWPHHILAADLGDLPIDHELVTLTSSFLNKSPPVRTPYTVKPRNNTAIYFGFSPSILALIFNLPGVYQPHQPLPYYEMTLKEEQLMSVHGINQDFMVIYGDDFAMHYITSVLNSIHAAERLSTHNFRIDYRIDYRNTDNQLCTFQSWKADSESNEAVPVNCQLTPFYSLHERNMAEFLLDKGASVEPQLLNGKMIDPVRFFIGKDNADVTQLLLDRLGDQDGISQDGASQDGARREAALRYALYDGKVEVIKRLWNKDSDIDTLGGIDDTIRQVIACRGNLRAMKQLLDKGADVDVQYGAYGNVLQAALYHGRIGVIQPFCDNDADISTLGRVYDTILQVVACYGNLEAMKHILDKGVTKLTPMSTINEWKKEWMNGGG